MSVKNNPRIRPVFKTAAIDDQEKFRPLPPLTGHYPYRLDIKKILPNLSDGQLIFHMTGDTGSLWSKEFQRSVVDDMTRQYENDQAKPAFLFHLGDVVYNFGQASKYYDQFFSPYRNYPAPVFAIAGNHDGDVDPADPVKPQSLDAFRTVFCDTEPRALALAGDTARKSNIQPNIYYTLQTPLADIICLYSNIPKFGTITKEQEDWFVQELHTLQTHKNGKMLIVCLHHAPYSADTNHGSGIHMINFLERTFTKSGVLPDAVFSGHVHNYQRFNRTYANGKVVPFIVAGAGGYSDLHSLARSNDPQFPDSSKLLDQVELQNYCDDRHGFLKLIINKTEGELTLSGEYYVIAQADQPENAAVLHDRFSVNITAAVTAK